ncbi:MAG: 50S ribosomal protein L18 [Candidatus Sumerlaeota bacterium]|nr:50S ribosomal protein L18 [Candidatus Sumerlaeota bacterium]
MKKTRDEYRKRRHLRRRMIIAGTPERPRLAARHTALHLYAQIVDDLAGRTLVSATTARKSEAGAVKRNHSNIASAKALGAEIAQKAKAAGLSKVVFDCCGGSYHGVLKALAEAAREHGLEF